MEDDDGARPTRGGYHHGDLGRALVEAATAIIAAEGVEALTLRGVGQRLGVSRTALYRHFADKAALLDAVALAGFQRLKRDLEAALGAAEGRGLDPLVALAEAYVGFGAEHPASYQTMFGPALRDRERNPALAAEGKAAFGVLARAITQGQAAGHLAPGDPGRIAQVVWAMIHGIVTLGADGQFGGGSPATEAGPTLTPFAVSMVLRGLTARPWGEAGSPMP